MTQRIDILNNLDKAVKKVISSLDEVVIMSEVEWVSMRDRAMHAHTVKNMVVSDLNELQKDVIDFLEAKD